MKKKILFFVLVFAFSLLSHKEIYAAKNTGVSDIEGQFREEIPPTKIGFSFQELSTFTTFEYIVTIKTSEKYEIMYGESDIKKQYPVYVIDKTQLTGNKIFEVTIMPAPKDENIKLYGTDTENGIKCEENGNGLKYTIDLSQSRTALYGTVTEIFFKGIDKDAPKTQEQNIWDEINSKMNVVNIGMTLSSALSGIIIEEYPDSTPIVSTENGMVSTVVISQHNPDTSSSTLTAVTAALNELKNIIKFISQFALGIAILTSILILIINLIRLSVAPSHPIQRRKLFLDITFNIICIAILGGITFFTRLAITIALPTL